MDCVSPFDNWCTIFMVSKWAQGDCSNMDVYSANQRVLVVLKCLLLKKFHDVMGCIFLPPPPRPQDILKSQPSVHGNVTFGNRVAADVMSEDEVIQE